jgi:peptidyl-prolyl cis-trans isomerase C
MENLWEKISPIKGAALPKTYRVVTVSELSMQQKSTRHGFRLCRVRGLIFWRYFGVPSYILIMLMSKGFLQLKKYRQNPIQFSAAFKPLVMLITVVAVSCVFISCKNKSQSPIVARVGSSVLTLDNLYKSIPQEYSDFVTREQMVNYVKQWIDNEILYQEALREKIDKEEQTRERLKKMKQDLLCAEMINRNSGSAQNIQISDDMVQHYYNENKSRFLHAKEAVRYIQIVVDDANTAWSVRSKATPDNFLNCASQFSKIPVPDPRAVPYVSVDEIPPQIAKEISTMQIGATSAPIKTELGYHIIRLLDKQGKGSIKHLDEVREDIINILSAKTQNALIEQMLTGLRSKMLVEIHLDVVPNNQKNSADSSSAAPESAPDSTIVN